MIPKNKLYVSMVLIVIILIVIFFFQKTENAIKKDSLENDDMEIVVDDTYSEETGTNHSDGAVFSMDLHNDNSTDDLNGEFKLYVKNVDDPMHFCFKNEGPAQTFRMKIYYDYQESDFSFVSDKDDKQNSFEFELGDGEELKKDIIIHNLKKDDKIHKLLCIVDAGTDLNVKDGVDLLQQDYMDYTQNLIYDLSAAEEYREKDGEEPDAYIDMLDCGFCVSDNMKEESVKEGKVSDISSEIRCKAGEDISLTYLIESMSSEESKAVMWAAFDGTAATINGKDTLVVRTMPEKMSMGHCIVKAPEEAGIYEMYIYKADSPQDMVYDLSASEVSENMRATVVVE